MMAECDDRRANVSNGLRGQGAERQPVHENDVARTNRVIHARDGFVDVATRRCGKSAGQGDVIDPRPETARRAKDAAVIFITAGQRVEVAGNCEENARHAATGPSNQARATCDSCSVTRILTMPSPPGPSAPERAAAAMASKM